MRAGVSATASKSDGPVRTCIGCRQRRPRQELVRLVRGADGNVIIDVARTAHGRGAYVCGDGACIEQGLGRERLGRAFRAASRVTPELMAAVVEHARRRDAAASAPVE